MQCGPLRTIAVRGAAEGRCKAIADPHCSKHNDSFAVADNPPSYVATIAEPQLLLGRYSAQFSRIAHYNVSSERPALQ